MSWPWHLFEAEFKSFIASHTNKKRILSAAEVASHNKTGYTKL